MNDKEDVSGRHHPGLGEWQEAERKLCRLFKSFGVDALEARDRLIDPYLDRALTFWRSHSGLEFTALTVEEAHSDLEIWFRSLFGDQLASEGSAIMIGRAAFLMCGGAKRWGDVLLQPVDDLADAFVAALRQHAPQAVPPSEMGDMHHQPYEAWSVPAMLAKALPIDRPVVPGFGSLIRRDGRGFAFNWRDTGSPS